GSVDAKGVRKYTVAYMVETDNQADEAVNIDLAIGVDFLAPYPTDDGALCKSRDVAQRQGELYIWDVTLSYDSEQSTTDRGTTQPMSGSSSSPSTPSSPGSNTSQT